MNEMNGILVALITILMVAIFIGWLITFFVIVRQKRAKVVELLGKFYTIKRAGLGIKPPFPFGSVVGEISLQIQELAVDISAKTSDNSFIEMPVKVQ
jgi:regulator of protease activity HflC (stomatin/prohibitin superfamily)